MSDSILTGVRGYPGVYTAALSTSVAFLPLNEITNANTTDAIVKKVETQRTLDVFPAGTDSSIIAGWEAQRDLIVKYTKTGKVAATEFMGGPQVATGLVLAKPFSRGFLSIASKDPFADPVVDYGTLRNSADLDIAVEMIRAWRKMLLTPSFQKLGPTAILPPDRLTSNADLQGFVRSNLQSSVFHPVGTAPMMKKEFGGVVGPDLLVHGTKKLAVICSSILPVLPGTHTTTTMYAVGEKVRLSAFIFLFELTYPYLLCVLQAADIIKSRQVV